MCGKRKRVNLFENNVITFFFSFALRFAVILKFFRPVSDVTESDPATAEVVFNLCYTFFFLLLIVETQVLCMQRQTVLFYNSFLKHWVLNKCYNKYVSHSRIVSFFYLFIFLTQCLLKIKLMCLWFLALSIKTHLNSFHVCLLYHGQWKPFLLFVCLFLI